MSDKTDKIDTVEQPEIRFARTTDYREGYSNSVQVRMSLWDFQLVFGTMQSDGPSEFTMTNFQAIYLSPQQTKALHNILTHNLTQYEATFGKIAIEPHGTPGPTVVPFPQGGGPVN